MYTAKDNGSEPNKQQQQPSMSTVKMGRKCSLEIKPPPPLP